MIFSIIGMANWETQRISLALHSFAMWCEQEHMLITNFSHDLPSLEKRTSLVKCSRNNDARANYGKASAISTNIEIRCKRHCNEIMESKSTNQRPPHDIQCIFFTALTAFGILIALGLGVGLIIVQSQPQCATDDPGGCPQLGATLGLLLGIGLVGSFTFCCCVYAVYLNVRDYRKRHTKEQSVSDSSVAVPPTSQLPASEMETIPV